MENTEFIIAENMKRCFDEATLHNDRKQIFWCFSENKHLSNKFITEFPSKVLLNDWRNFHANGGLELSRSINKHIEFCSNEISKWALGKKHILFKSTTEAFRLFLFNRYIIEAILFVSSLEFNSLLILGSEEFKAKISSRLHIQGLSAAEKLGGVRVYFDYGSDINQNSCLEFGWLEKMYSNYLEGIQCTREVEQDKKSQYDYLFYLQSHLKTVNPSVSSIIERLVTSGAKVGVIHEREIIVENLSDNIDHFLLFPNGVDKLGAVSFENINFSENGPKAKNGFLNFVFADISKNPKDITSIFEKEVLAKVVPLVDAFESLFTTKLIAVSGRGLNFQLFIELFKNNFSKIISFQNAYFGRYYTYSKMLGDHVFVLDNHAKELMVNDFNIAKSKVIVSGNPRYSLVLDKVKPIKYSASLPWTLLVFGQPGIEQSFSLILNQIFIAENYEKFPILEIVFRPHPRQTKEQIQEVIDGVSQANRSRISIKQDEPHELASINLLGVGISSNFVIELTIAGILCASCSNVPGYIIPYHDMGCGLKVDHENGFDQLFRNLRDPIFLNQSKLDTAKWTESQKCYSNQNLISEILEKIENV